MAIRLRSDSPREFLAARADQGATKPTAQPEGMCILSGQLLRRNLQTYLDRNGIPTTALAHYTTIEELSSNLLDPTSEPSQMISSGVRDRLTEEILQEADPHTTEAASVFDPQGLLRPIEAEALADLAERLPYDEEETREALLDELDDYYRWTDAASDVSPAMRQLRGIESQFAILQSNRSMNAFRGLERLTEARLDALPTDSHQSRSHLVNAARKAVDAEWPTQFGHIEWIAIQGISVFDNPTLRFIATIADHPAAPDIHIFSNDGTITYNARRLDALSVETDTPPPGDHQTPSFNSEAAAELFHATGASPSGIPNPVTFLEAPTSQRAVEQVAEDVRDLIQNGTHPREILIVAPNAGSYQSLIEHAFETVEIPVHVETRRPFANIPIYRCFRTFVDIIDTVERDEPVTYGDLVDPLRLGYCPPGESGASWPIEGRAVTKIEQELHRKQQYENRDPDRYEGQGLLFEDWRALIDDIPEWTGSWWAVETYLDDIESQINTPPTTGDELEERFGSYLGTYVYQTVDHERALYEGPAVDTTRTSLDEIHPTSQAELVRSSLGDVSAHYDRIQELFDVPPSWSEVGRAFSAALGGQSYGRTHLDQHAIPVVDAGNAFFRQASHLYVLGMNADEFPGERPTATFLHGDLREQVYNAANVGDTPYHHLDSRATGYGEALDFYQATLAAATAGAEITLCHTYRDERGNAIAWSPFVDLFDLKEDADPADRPVERVAVGDWLPSRRDTETWVDVADRTAPRERLRMLLYNAHRNYPDSEPAITVSDLVATYARLPDGPLEQLVLPRLERYTRPPTSVEIAPDEAAFAETALSEITGSPHHPHELDLQSQCGLKYYYYQFLYNYTGDLPNRAEIPKYTSQREHYRLGQIPYLIRENYADPRYVDKWRQIVEELLPERQSISDGLAKFDSAQELRDWVEAQDAFDSFDLNTIYSNLRAERVLVASERAAGVEREWTWREGDEIEIDGHTLAVPSYRLDTVTSGDSAYQVPIFFTRFSNRAASALKACFHGKIWEVDERNVELCLSCDNDDCSYRSKYVIDHRMLAGYAYESDHFGSKVVGIGLQEQFAGPDDGHRVVAIKNNYADKIQPFDGDGFEQLIGRGFPQSWTEKREAWEANFTHIASTVNTDATIRFEANPEIVVRDDCLDCVYRELCMVPDREVITDGS